MNELGTELCDLCIDIMKWWAHKTGISYGLINILLFVVIHPLITIFATAVAMVNNYSINKKLKNVLTLILFFIVVLGFCFVLFFVGYPPLYERLNMVPA